MIHSTTPKAKRGAFATLAFLAAPTFLWAQVSLYQYSESVETYTEVTADQAAFSLGVPTWWPPANNLRAWVNNPFFDPAGQAGVSYLNPAIGPGYPIGFNFSFNGEVFDVLSVSNSGFITFGKSSDGLQAVWTYAISHPHGMPFVQYIGGPPVPYQRNRVAGWGGQGLQMQDMSPQVPPGPVSSIRIATLGTAPNRTCVVQFKDFRGSYSPSTTLINFQIRLNEADNSVAVRFGNVVFGFDSGGPAQIGLGGSVPEDFNSRQTVYEQPAFLYDWNITQAGVLNTDACNATEEVFGHPNGSGVPPVSGRTFKWTPDACPPPTWPLAISDVSFDGATASWNATSSGTYEYFLTDTDDVNGTEVASGTTTDATTTFFGLSPATTYYVFIRSICNGEPGVWSLATPFHTMGGGVVECNGGAVEETYCSHQNDTIYWRYVSADGSALRIEFLDGYVGTNSLKAWDGPDASGTPLTMSGDIDGNALNALSGAIFIQLVTDNGSCETQDWYLPVHWRVGCKNCTDPLVNFSVGTVDCDQQQFYVDVNAFSLGSSTTLEIENNAGLPATTISTAGVHSVGPFPAGEPVTLTAQNPDNMMCYVQSAPVVNEPCAIIGCGPTWYERCAHPSETRDWLLQGDGQPISVRFPPLSLGFDAQVIVYDGGDEMAASQTVSTMGLLNNQVVTSTNAQNQLLVRLIASVYPDYACSEGNGQPFRFVAACASGCSQPQATFATAPCTESTSFSVDVNVTNAGSGPVVITNDAGVAPTAVTGIGTYTAGPFPSGSVVVLELQGANEVCTWTANPLSKDCTTMGIAAIGAGNLRIAPNPSNGTFRLDLDNGASGNLQVHVLDLTGRVVAEQPMTGSNTILHLEHLPSGLYTVVAQGTSMRFTSKISIQH